jgi:hypothetical protein
VNLNLKASYPVSGYSPQVGAGLVAGYSAGGSLTSCFAEGSIEGSTKMMMLQVGGIVGQADTQLENCVSAVTKVSGESDSANIISVGGITGSNSASLVSSSLEAEHQVTIQAQYTGSANAQVYAGGISGTGSGITKCVVDAEVEIIAETASADTSLYAGGIVGQGGNISSSFVRRGEVLAKQTADTGTSQRVLAGGISGSLSGGVNPSITNSFSKANVTVENVAPPLSALNFGGTAAGGIAGYMTGSTHIIKSGASGTVKTVSKSSEAGPAVFAGGIAGVASISGISIEQSTALNGSVTVESAATPPHAYRVLGGVSTTSYPATVVALEDIPDTTTLTLSENYALADLIVQTKTGTADLEPVPQDNDSGNLTGSDNMSLTQDFFVNTLEWDFETDWAWDDAANLPVPRYE